MAEEDPPVSDPATPSAEAPKPNQANDALAAVLAQATDPQEAANMDQATIDDILKQASFEDPSQAIDNANPETAAPQSSPATVSAEDFKLPDFQQVMQDAQMSSIDLLKDVELNVKIELGRARMLVEDVLKLAEGSVVELDKLAGDPVDVFVNERLVARGEVLVLNDNFCVRVNEIVAGVKEEGL